jgi:hypothetical protein
LVLGLFVLIHLFISYQALSRKTRYAVSKLGDGPCAMQPTSTKLKLCQPALAKLRAGDAGRQLGRYLRRLGSLSGLGGIPGGFRGSL